MRRCSRWLRADRAALLVVAVAVVVANAPALAGVVDPNPLGPRSGLVSAVAAGPLPGEAKIDPNDGFTSQALGHRAALDLLHLRLPWWNSYEGTGAPLAGGMVSAALFPPTLLTAVSNGQVYERVLLELVAGLCTYLLLRRLLLRCSASAAGAIAFALNGTFAWFGHVPIDAVAVMPPLLLGVELAYARSVAGQRGGWWLVALAGAASIYAGFPEVAYLGGLFAFCWLGWRCAGLRGEALRRLFGKAAAGVVVAALLGAPLLVASLDYLADATVGAHAGGQAGATHLAAPALSQLVLPYVYGPIFAFGDPKLELTRIWGQVGGYLSTSLLLFALFGLFSSGRRGLRLMLLVWIVLALARIYGVLVLGDVLGVLPRMAQVAFYRYGSASVEFAVVVLAALGLEAAARSRPSKRRLAVAALGVLGLVALASLGARPLAGRLGGGYSVDRYLVGSVAWGATVVLVGAGALLLRDSRARALLASALVAGDALVLFALPQASAPRRVRLDLAPVAFLQRHLGTARFFTLGPLQPDYGSYFGLAQLNVNDAIVPTVFARYVHGRLDQVVDPLVFVGNLGGGRSASAPSPTHELMRNLAGYRAAGVAYVLAPASQALPQSPATFRLVFRSPSTWIYELAGGAPYVDAPGCAVDAANRDAVHVMCPHAAQLVRRETDLPGWSARLDGRPARLGRADGLYQSLDVPAGPHTVTFRYAPPYIDAGYAAFAAGCVCLLLPAARRRRP